MESDPKTHPFEEPQGRHRRSIRLQGYDYSQAGAYYITIVTYGRECLFGQVFKRRNAIESDSVKSAKKLGSICPTIIRTSNWANL